MDAASVPEAPRRPGSAFRHARVAGHARLGHHHPVTDEPGDPAPSPPVWEPPPGPPIPFDPLLTEPPRPLGQDDRPRPKLRSGRLARLGIGALAVVVVLATGIAIGRASVGVSGSAASASPSAGSSSSGASWLLGLPTEGMRIGRADAKVVLTYWADYQCPFCARFAQSVLPQLASRIADGTLAIEHRDYAFLGEESIAAAVAVRCAGRDGRYWPMHDGVYAAQQGENQGAFVRQRLEQIAASVGIDATSFAACLDERPVLVDVLADTADGIRSGVASTPTIDVNGTRFLGVSDVAALLRVIDAAAAGASPAPTVTPAPSKDPWSDTTTSGREAGPASAPVTVELWMDYQSPDTAIIPRTLEPELRTRIAAGKIRVVLRDLATLGDESVLAGVAVRCVATVDARTWPTSDVLAVSGQGAGTGLYTPATILRFVARMGMDVRSIDTCLADPSVAAAVRAETAAGVAAGLTAGPAIVVLRGGKEASRFTGAIDVAKVLAAIDAAH